MIPRLTRSVVAADTVAALMRAGVIPATGDAEARICHALDLSHAVLADARRRLLADAASNDDLPVAGPRPCPPPTPEEWEWLGFRAPEFALWRCDRCGRPFHNRRHYDAHMAAIGAARGRAAQRIEAIA